MFKRNSREATLYYIWKIFHSAGSLRGWVVGKSHLFSLGERKLKDPSLEFIFISTYKTRSQGWLGWSQRAEVGAAEGRWRPGAWWHHELPDTCG